MTGSRGGIQSLSLWLMHKAMTSSHGMSVTEGPAPRPGEGLRLFHLPYVLRSRLSTWDWRTGCVWRELGIWEAYWTTMEHTGGQGAGERAAGGLAGVARGRVEVCAQGPPLGVSLGAASVRQMSPPPSPAPAGARLVRKERPPGVSPQGKPPPRTKLTAEGPVDSVL